LPENDRDKNMIFTTGNSLAAKDTENSQYTLSACTVG